MFLDVEGAARPSFSIVNSEFLNLSPPLKDAGREFIKYELSRCGVQCSAGRSQGTKAHELTISTKVEEVGRGLGFFS